MARNKPTHSFFFDAFSNGRPQVSSAGDKERRWREHYYTLDGTLISRAKNGRSYSCQQPASWPNKFCLMPCQDAAMLGCVGAVPIYVGRRSKRGWEGRRRRSERQIWFEGNKCSAALSARFPRRYSDAQDYFELTKIGSVAGQVAESAVFHFFLIVPLSFHSRNFWSRKLALGGPLCPIPIHICTSQTRGNKERQQQTLSVYSDSVRELTELQNRMKMCLPSSERRLLAFF